ncbi:TPA: hypothetical protein MI633_27685 [Klebsiella pneumoniae]|nr:hypothetical protein [Klebsiella pneumoniae]
MKRTEITAIIQENTQQQSAEIQELLRKSSESLKKTIQQQLKEEQIRIEKDIKSHRIRTYNKIEKLLKEKIQILNISMLQAILILLSLNLFCCLMIMIRIVIRG